MRNRSYSFPGPADVKPAARAVVGRVCAPAIALCGVVLAVGACGMDVGSDPSHKVNGSVHVEAGKPATSAESVNGSIHIAADAAVTEATTVNGSIHVGAHATASAAKTVNGGITLDEGAHVAGSVTSVNGSLTLKDGAEVAGALKNVSGNIELRSAHVAGGIRTVSGDVSVLGGSHVEGGIVVQKPGGSLITISGGPPRIVIGAGATVQGDLRFEREVRLYVSDKATIGPVTGATAIAFSGDLPPG
jgi:hypothetical protein